MSRKKTVYQQTKDNRIRNSRRIRSFVKWMLEDSGYRELKFKVREILLRGEEDYKAFLTFCEAMPDHNGYGSYGNHSTVNYIIGYNYALGDFEYLWDSLYSEMFSSVPPRLKPQDRLRLEGKTL